MRAPVARAIEELAGARRAVVEECTEVRRRRRALRTVLLVEDEPQTARLVENVLRDTCDVVVARDAEEALRVFRERPIALAIVDLSLPGGATGVELADRLRPAILLFSGADAEDIRLTAETCRADAWLAKDGDVVALRVAVERLLAERAG